MSEALVVARTERQRMLRELLDTSDRSLAQRVRYAELIQQEWLDTAPAYGEDTARLACEKQVFGALLGKGIDTKTALEESKSIDTKEQTEGQTERARRRRIREAVTAFDARSVVTFGGPIWKCLVCGETLPCRSGYRRMRRDRVYCGPACKMRAFRARGSP